MKSVELNNNNIKKKKNNQQNYAGNENLCRTHSNIIAIPFPKSETPFLHF